MRALLEESFRAAVAAADPLKILGPHLPPPPRGRIFVAAAGKAAASMALAVEKNYSFEVKGIAITRYGHGLLLAETFVDPTRFRGTCYRAANWVCLGPTQGAGKRGNRYRRHGVPKLVFVYPLHRHARERLAAP